MNIIRRITGTLRPGRNTHRGPAEPSAARWRQRAMLADVRRDLDELADERAFVDTEITRSRTTLAQLEADATAADADGCADVARELREERMQAHGSPRRLLKRKRYHRVQRPGNHRDLKPWPGTPTTTSVGRG